ncbi:catabolite control protein A [Aerococcus urinaehominis]|uniref:Catabolite control protein A n=1 Tax=Aerococcus urinaehominis TaxID=128944 RepID=A0A109RGR0_9LACT|nr:catabolite control protein A [Aerococcus urinaehominis]AMB98886.1 catabolite control protein A [Aerococcus urinaehominis]SDM15967.1 transcriptional regulator, LacI family [Aerococcus urinaehominis]
MEKQTVTIYDVAREAGVSMATVSRVVNGNTNVKPSTREKVMKVIEALDYRPNAVARGLASKRTTTVGVIIPDITNLFFSSLAQGIDDIAKMYKYNIILTNAEEGQEENALSSVLARQVDGIVYMGHSLPENIRKELKRSRIPVVLAAMNDSKEEFSSVNIDYETAIYEVTQRLIKSGRQHVAFVAQEDYLGDNQPSRLNGYKRAIKVSDLPVEEDLIFGLNQGKYKNAYDFAEKLKNSRADAAVIINDEIAAGILNYLQDEGVNVPEDFSLVSSNDSAVVEMVRPRLTSICPPLYDIGAVAMRILTKMMDKDDDDEIDKVVTLPYKISERQSTRDI